jgi:hypothetical protein
VIVDDILGILEIEEEEFMPLTDTSSHQYPRTYETDFQKQKRRDYPDKT